MDLIQNSYGYFLQPHNDLRFQVYKFKGRGHGKRFPKMHFSYIYHIINAAVPGPMNG